MSNTRKKVDSKRHLFSARCLLPIALCSLLSAACRMDMQDQPRYEAYEPSTFFKDGQSSRPLVEGTIPRGYLREDSIYYTGKSGAGASAPTAQSGTGAVAAGNIDMRATAGTANAQPGGGAGADQTDIDYFPIEITSEVLNNGQERFNAFCSMCHGQVGDGDGMVVRRGLRRPPSFHTDDLRQARIGHFFDVITNGWGAMPSYSYMIPVQDRWAIVAYIRALQLSQAASLEDVPIEERGKLGNGGATAPGGGPTH